MADVVARSVLELTTGGTLQRELEQLRGGARTTDSEFEQLRRRVQDVGVELRRTVERFQGRAVIDEAKRVAQAIGAIGGVSKLTAREVKDAQRTIDEATDKLRRMGEEVPASLRKVSAELKTLDDTSKRGAGGGIASLVSGLGGLRTILPALSIAGGVSFVAALGTQALTAADNIVKFSERTGTSIETTQRWQYVAGQTSTTLEAFAGNAFKLGINLSAGTDKVRGAVNELGLSWDALGRMSPEAKFNAVIQALEGVEDVTERNRLGQALFGRQFAEIAVAVAEGFTKMSRDASVASDDQVRAAEAAGDAWERFKQRVAAATIGVLGRMASEFIDTAASVDSLTAAQLAQFRVEQKLGTGHLFLIGIARERRQAEEEAAEAAKKAAQHTTQSTAAERDYVRELADLKAKLAELKPERRAQLDAAIELEGVSKELAAAFGLSEDALRLYQGAQRDGEKATKAHTTTLREHAKEIERVKKLGAAVELDLHLKALAGVGVRADLAKTNTELAAHIGALDRTTTTYVGLIPAVASWQSQLVALKAPVTEANGGIVQQTHDLHTLQLQWAAIGKTVTTVLAQAFTGGGGVEGAFKALGAIGGGKLGEHLGKALTTAIGGKLGAAIGGMAGPLGAALGSLGGSLIGKLFGGGEGRKVNDLRDTFTAAAGGIHELNVKAQAAGLTLDRFLKAKTVKEYEAAVDELKAAFDRLDRERAENLQSANDLFSDIMEAGRTGIPASLRPTIDRLKELGLLTADQIEQLDALGDSSGPGLERMDQAAQTLGARLESLGTRYSQAKLDEKSKLYNDAINDLIAGGADVGGVLFDAREELSGLVDEAMKSGKTLPANLKPWIDDLAASGNLIDAAGNKITDTSAIKWGDPIKTEAEIAADGWAKIIDRIDALIAKITGPLERAIEGVPREVDIEAKLRYSEEGRPDFGGGGQYGGFEPGFADGIFRGRFPQSGMRVRVHNIESIVPRQKEMAFAQRVIAEQGRSMSSSSLQLLPIIMGTGLSAHDIGRKAAQFLAARGLAVNTAGVATAIEQVVENYLRTYGGA